MARSQVPATKHDKKHTFRSFRAFQSTCQVHGARLALGTLELSPRTPLHDRCDATAALASVIAPEVEKGAVARLRKYVSYSGSVFTGSRSERYPWKQRPWMLARNPCQHVMERAL
jgi:hypothetical protein